MCMSNRAIRLSRPAVYPYSDHIPPVTFPDAFCDFISIGGRASELCSLLTDVHFIPSQLLHVCVSDKRVCCPASWRPDPNNAERTSLQGKVYGLMIFTNEPLHTMLLCLVHAEFDPAFSVSCCRSF